jgi:putative NADH-flavin reductase
MLEPASKKVTTMSMKVVVFGATGKIGREVVEHALAQGHGVTAFVREQSAKMLENETSSVEDRPRLVIGDAFDFSAVRQAVRGQDAIICALGSNSLTKTTIRGEGTANIVKAMEKEHVDRLLVVSAMGTAESWSALSFVNKLFYATLLSSSRRDHEAQEAVVKKSSLNWTIVRPSGLTDGALTGSYDIGENIQAKSSRISSADVAHAIVKELDQDAFIGKAVTITN